MRYLVADGAVAIAIGDEPALWHPLTSLDGAEITKETRKIEGTIWRRGDGAVLLSVDGTWIRDYLVGDATPESVAYLAGWRRAMRQKIRRAPDSDRHGRDHFYGWLDGWKERRSATGTEEIDR